MNDFFGHDSTPIALRDYQDLGMRMMRESVSKGARSVLLVAPTGCHQFGTMILMADGSTRAVETIQIGDQVMGPDSRPRNVLHLHRGIDEMFRVSPKKGEPFTVNGDHILALTVTNDGSKHAGKTEFVTVRQWLAGNLTFKHTRKLFRTAVEFPQKDLPIAPYMLGILLGDGCIRDGAIVANPDIEIRQALLPMAQAAGLEIHEHNRPDRCPTFSLVTGIGKPNPLIRSLKKLGLMGGNAYDKFVPDDYRLGSTEQRLELLAGLMDTDGSLSGNGYDYISASHALASDVVFLARSVGLAAYLTGCEKKWQNGVGDYWRVSISGDTDKIPCRVERKKARARTQVKNVLVTGFACESVGTGTYYGFECDGDHLYVMGDFTVTHNSGKTTWAADMIRSCREKGGRAMFLAPRRELVHQASARLRSAGIPHGIVMAQADHLEDLTQPVQVCSIDTLISRLFRKGRKIELPDFSLVIMDEAHLAVTERRKDLMQHWPKAILVGLTATPIRKDGRALGMMFEDMVQPTSVKALTEAGYLVPARYFSVAKPDLARIKVTAGDYNAKALDDAMNTPTLVGDIVQHWMELAAARRTVVFCTSIKHSVAVCEQFQRNGVAAEHVDANTPTDEREDIFKRFTSGKTQILTNCFLASYGFDLPALSCVVLARPTKSLMLYLQMCLDSSTEILTKRGWVGRETVRDDDIVAGYDQHTGSIEWCAITDRVDRDIASVESMYSASGPHIDIRVTDGHDLLVKSRSGTSKHWKKQTAAEAATRKETFKIPVAGFEDCDAAPLTDAEIQFIGWFLTDGTRNKITNAITICQSVSRPEKCAEIERVIRACGFKFGACRISRKDETAGYPDLMHYTISFGEPRGRDKHLSGYQNLAPWLDKNLSDLCYTLDRRQLSVLLHAMWLGDGWALVPDNYEKKTIDLTCGDNKQLADRLQALCVLRGYRCNQYTFKSKLEGRKDLYNLHIRDRHYVTLAGTSNSDGEIKPGKPYTRTRLKMENERKGERVWCVTNRLGTLVTRRNGKVVIMGNCGRALRPAPEKKDALILDHSGCVHQHGFADQERAWSLDGLYSFGDKKASKPKEAKDVQPIECPECHAVFSKSAICPECGYRLKTIGEYMETAEGKLVEIATGFEVDKEMGTPQFYQELKSIAEENGYKPGWAAVNYKEKFGDWPPRDWNRLPALAPTQATRRWLKSKHIAWIRGKAAAEMRAQA